MSHKLIDEFKKSASPFEKHKYKQRQRMAVGLVCLLVDNRSSLVSQSHPLNSITDKLVKIREDESDLRQRKAAQGVQDV
jgi:hypothetical protein